MSRGKCLALVREVVTAYWNSTGLMFSFFIFE
jgi:hypothetical protein